MAKGVSLRFYLRFLSVALQYGFEKAKLGATRLVKKPSENDNGGIKRVLIVPCDFNYIVGSKGDEAMLTALVESIREKVNNPDFGIVTASCDIPDSVVSLGIKCEPCWSAPWRLGAVLAVISRYDYVVVIGADVMDGYYSPISASRLWSVLDLANRAGKLSVLLGFSFNGKSSSIVKHFVRNVSNGTVVNVRDCRSFERFVRVSPTLGARLVADSAFNLKPRDDNPSVRAVLDWLDSQRGGGRFCLCFNVHPMLFSTREELDAALYIVTKVLGGLVEDRAVSIVLLSHDYREVGIGDCAPLRQIFELLPESVRGYFLLPEDRFHAAELKAIAGGFDLVVTGRMHLAIAALGQGVPVAALVYQDKFQGLMDHFGLSDDLLLDPSKLLKDEDFYRFLTAALDQADQVRSDVQESLPRVMDLARLNFRELLERAS